MNLLDLIPGVRALRARCAHFKDNHDRCWRTIDALNDVIKSLRRDYDDKTAELASAHERILALDAAVRRPPALFRREAELSNEAVHHALAGKGDETIVRALLQILDTAAIEAMSESAIPPTTPVATGPGSTAGYTETQRTFSAGGAFALTTLKQRIETHLAARQSE